MCNPIPNTSPLPTCIEIQTMLDRNADMDETFCTSNDNGNVSQVHSQIFPNIEEENDNDNDSVNTVLNDGRISTLNYSEKDDPQLLLNGLGAKMLIGLLLPVLT